MKKIWNPDLCEILTVYDDYKIMGRFQIGPLYFEMITDNETGNLTAGWVPEHEFETGFGRDLKRSDFTKISYEEIIALIAQKKISTPLYLTDGKK